MFFGQMLLKNIDGWNGRYPVEKWSLRSTFGKNNELKRYLSISTCRSVKKKNAAEEESDQWFISEVHVKPRFSKDAFSNISYVIASFFDIFICFQLLKLIGFTLLDCHKRIAEIILNTINNAICSFDKKAHFLKFL